MCVCVDRRLARSERYAVEFNTRIFGEFTSNGESMVQNKHAHNIVDDGDVRWLAGVVRCAVRSICSGM